MNSNLRRIRTGTDSKMLPMKANVFMVVVVAIDPAETSYADCSLRLPFTRNVWEQQWTKVDDLTTGNMPMPLCLAVSITMTDGSSVPVLSTPIEIKAYPLTNPRSPSNGSGSSVGQVGNKKTIRHHQLRIS